MSDRLDRITGVVLGTAVGDALGLPREGMSARRAAKMFGSPPLRHRFVFGRGMTSDDTEHTCLLAQALVRQPDDTDAFARSLAWGLRFWLLGLPAGIGSATLRGTLKLWLGFPPRSSGVWSAGNGPAMRAALLGVCLGHDPDRLRAAVRAATRITHRDPRAERGAWLVAFAAHYGARHDQAGVRAADFLAAARSGLHEPDERLLELLDRMGTRLAEGAPAADLAADLNQKWGVTGYVYHTVPLALYCWLRWPGDFRRAVEEVIALGGDTDTTGAITGALAGATAGAGVIPAEWLDGILEWPRSVAWMRRLASRLAEQFPGEGEVRRPRPLPLFWPGLAVRNLLFFGLVLLHVFRRLLPPY